MGDKSKIEWTDATWNPIVGCSVVSPGCTHCYAMGQAARIERMQPGSHYAQTTMVVSQNKAFARPPGKSVWTGKVALAPDHILTAPLRWKRPRRVFVNSMGDLFHESVPDEWIDRVFAVMALAPQHTFQVLTKRSVRMREYLTRTTEPSGKYITVEDDGTFHDTPKAFWSAHAALCDMLPIAPAVALNFAAEWQDNHYPDGDGFLQKWPLPNVQLGVSVEDQRRADERVPDLLATPAAVRLVSAEPLLGQIDFERVGTLDGIRAALPGIVEREEQGRPTSGAGSISAAQIDAIGSRYSSITFFQTPDHMGGFTAASPRQWPRLDWIIVGGESGPRARPMHPDWARSIRDQCAAAGVPFFFKQWGEWAPAMANTGDAGDGLMTRVGKHRAGRLLDRREHSEFPGALHAEAAQ